MWPNPHEIADLVTFAEEILNREFHFLCSDSKRHVSWDKYCNGYGPIY